MAATPAVQRGTQLKVGGAPLLLGIFPVVNGSWKPSPSSTHVETTNADEQSYNDTFNNAGEDVACDVAIPFGTADADLPKPGDVLDGWLVVTAPRSDYGGKPVKVALTIKKRDSLTYS